MPCGFGKHLWSVTADGLQCYKNVCQLLLNGYTHSDLPRTPTDAPLLRRLLLLATHTRQTLPRSSLPPDQSEFPLPTCTLRHCLRLYRLHTRLLCHIVGAMQPAEDGHYNLPQQPGTSTGYPEHQHGRCAHHHAGRDDLESANVEKAENCCRLYPWLRFGVSRLSDI